MTMTDIRAAALGEFPAPPPCPTWCETDHEVRDYKSLTGWSRFHGNLVEAVRVGDSDVRVQLYASDRFYGGRWESREVEIGLVVDIEAVWAGSEQDKRGLIAVARLISPEVLEMVQAAALLVSSPEVTPAGEDQ